MTTIIDLQRIAEIQFSDIVLDTYLLEHKLRITLIDSSVADVHVSQKLSNKFSFHWETKDAAGTIYRYDNFPDRNWSYLSSYPYHFHKGEQNTVEDPPFPLDIINGFIAFMEFVKSKITKSN